MSDNEYENVSIYRGRKGQRVGICRDDEGNLTAILVESPDGSWERHTRPPAWVKPGLHHERCVRARRQGKSPCWRCIPSLDDPKPIRQKVKR
jgi:hypothetical protein